MPANQSIAVKFNFFQIEYAKDEAALPRLSVLLEELRQQPFDKRIHRLSNTPCFLTDDYESSHGNKAFLFTCNRTELIPLKVKADGTRESLGLTDDEGLGEDVALACDPTDSVVAIQYNRHSLSEGKISQYIHATTGRSVNFLPALKLNALEKMIEAKQIRKMHLKFARAADLSHLKNKGYAVGALMELQSVYDAATLEITCSASHEREGLGDIFRKLMEGLNAHAREAPDHILSLDTVIRTDDGSKTEALDLLADRIFTRQKVALQRKEINKEDLLSAACAALVEKKDDLAIYKKTQKNP